MEKLKGDWKNEIAYRKLVDSTLALTILFNRRRIGAVQYLYIESYQKDFSTNNADECLKTLTKSELHLTKHYKRVITGGKGCRAVPVLFPQNLQNFIQKILNCREKTNIVPKENPYLFSYPKSKNRWTIFAIHGSHGKDSRGILQVSSTLIIHFRVCCM